MRQLLWLLFVLPACSSAGPGADASAVDARAIDSPPADGAVATDAGVVPDTGPPTPLRVLFVGNSYTEVNDLPSVTRALGVATGWALEVESITPGSTRLVDHWTTTGARERIEMGGLDAVVIQGQSLEAMTDPKSFDYYASLLSGAISASGADGVWYATWARVAGDPLYAELGLGDPAYMTRMIDARYQMAASLDDDVAARVGAAWQIALAELPEVPLHSGDGSHPTPAGTLLAGCVILQALTGQTPRVPDPPPVDVPAEIAAALCAIAPRVRCPDAMAFCDGACVDVQYNADHCGTCDIACAGEDPCRAGVCGCDPGLTGCSERCVALASDPQHCGGCATSCSIGALCVSGACACPRGAALDITFDHPASIPVECDPTLAAGTPACNAAAHAYCADLECFDSGFGPPSGHAPTVDFLMCVRGDVRATTYTELQTFAPACDGIAERGGQPCATAISRYCASTGAVSGFGPVDAPTGDALTVTCLPSATIVHTTLAAVGAFVSRCIPDPVTCSVASWSFCESMGHAGGFGPVEVSGTDIDVVCIDP